MKAALTIWLLFVFATGFAQQAESERLDSALMTKNEAELHRLLHPRLTFGHSNGWIQRHADVFEDLRSGKLLYRKLESSDVVWTLQKERATRRSTTEATFVLDGKEATIRLHVLQVWVKTKRGWQLLARQSVKL